MREKRNKRLKTGKRMRWASWFLSDASSFHRLGFMSAPLEVTELHSNHLNHFQNIFSCLCEKAALTSDSSCRKKNCAFILGWRIKSSRVWKCFIFDKTNFHRLKNSAARHTDNHQVAAHVRGNLRIKAWNLRIQLHGILSLTASPLQPPGGTVTAAKCFHSSLTCTRTHVNKVLKDRC